MYTGWGAGPIIFDLSPVTETFRLHFAAENRPDRFQ